MNDPENQFESTYSRQQEEQASEWVARHERGLSEDEKRSFEQWLSEAPNNEACFFEHQVAWASFDVMDEWKPNYSSPPNPDLFETQPKRKWSSFVAFGGLAAAVLLGFFLLQINRQKTDNAETVVVTTYKSQSNEKHFLEDGSSFYLLSGSEVRVTITEFERNIEFVSGEVEFTVAHDRDRPFVVHSDIGRVTALGTIFSVRQDSNSWEVFVTEGKVKVDEAEEDESVASENEAYSTELVAGQIMVEELSDEDFSPKIEVISANELKEKLAWKDQIIDMVSAPLEEILIEFRRFNQRKVIIYDEELKRMRMTVAIKPDNLEDFIDLLELSSGVKATDTPSGSILLTRSSN
jgi:transmembrane sensor